MRIALVTPAGPGLRNGNRHTAVRWATFLRAAGHRVHIATPSDSEIPEADVLLALHARRSHAPLKAFAQRFPQRARVLALTGTDVYRDIRDSAQAQESLELAHRLIVLQPAALNELAPRHRRKAVVVVQSCATQLRHAPVRRVFRVCVVGHLREEKDPLRTLVALRRVPERAIEVVHLGAALDPTFAEAAAAGMREDDRYRWLGGVPHWRALQWLASSHAMVISSRMEGGANVVCEALRIGVPVLASRISGNLGLLGRRYPAYFAVGDDAGLARLLRRAATDDAYYGELKRAVRALRASVAPAAERRALLAAMQVR